MCDCFKAKMVLADSGSILLELHRDRQAAFASQLFEKYCRYSPSSDDNVNHLFAQRLSTNWTREAVRELCGGQCPWI